MNKHQKLVQQQFLNNEKKVIDRLDWVYQRSQKDVNEKIKDLQFKIDGLQQAYDWMDDNDPEKAKIKSMIQSKIYQKQYQEQLKSQIDGILNEMQTKQFLTVSDYLDDCYTDGFVGTIFDAHGQGVPIITPIDQQSLVRAVQLDSKISKGLYTRLGEDITKLKKRIASHVSRGISSGMSYGEVANALKGLSKFGYNNAIRIARTEGHRIQTTAAMDAMTAAKDMGADVVKQWDSTLDARTRESHAIVDGEIRELDKPFSNGLDYPGDPSGKAAEVINCRCALLQRARWALDDDELQTLQDRAAYYGLDKTANFEDFKATYLKAVENPVVDVGDIVGDVVKFTPAKTIEEAEEYAHRFVSTYQSKYSGNVSFKGMDVDHANKVNNVLTEVYDRYDIDVHDNIAVMNFRESKWKTAVDDGVAAAYQWGGNGGSLYLNQKLIGTAKTEVAFIQNADDLLKTVLAGADTILQKPNLNPTQRTYIEALVRSGRQCVAQSVDDFTECTIVHEMGHSLDNKLFRKHFKTLSNPDGFDIRASMEQFAPNISGYAASTKEEYVAESFAAWWYGMDDIVDPELAKIFKGCMKK